MTRRAVFLGVAATRGSAQAALSVPVHQIVDSRAILNPEQLGGFRSRIWPEAVRDFQRGGIDLQCTYGDGEIRRSPGGRPVFHGLRPAVVNFVLTGRIPMEWDHGRGLAGVATRYEGRHICMAALHQAHSHLAPFVSVNTCVHELLHVLMGDIYDVRPGGLSGAAREFRIDWHATRLWLFHDGGAIRRAAQTCLDRLRREDGH